MSGGRPLHDDEIDLIELFQTLWDGRWKIIATTFVAALIGIAFSIVKPYSYEGSTPIKNGKQFVFLPYTALNDLLEKHQFSLSIDEQNVFRMFVSEFNDYEEMVDVLSKNEYVKQSIEDLDEIEKQRALIEFAKLFALKPSPKNAENWLLSFEWYDDLEGVRLFDDAIQQTLINVQKTAIVGINELALAIDVRNSRELENLRNELNLIEQKQIEREKKGLQYLAEQSAIARELGIASNRLDATGLSKSSQNGISLSFNSSDIPYYLRGYKAIDKEIALIKKRSDEEMLLMATGYIEIREKIVSLENDLSSSQLRAASKMIATDSPNDWVEFDLALAESKSDRKSIFYVALSIVLGGMIGAVHVLISNAIQKRKEQLAKA